MQTFQDRRSTGYNFDMNTTMKSFMLGFVALLLAGCSAGGPGAAAPSPSASISPEVRKLAGVLTSDTRLQLDKAVKEFNDSRCDVVYSRGYTSEGYHECREIRQAMARHAGRLESEFGYRDSWPLEVDALALRTKTTLSELHAITDSTTNADLIQPTVQAFYGALLEWAPYID